MRPVITAEMLKSVEETLERLAQTDWTAYMCERYNLMWTLGAGALDVERTSDENPEAATRQRCVHGGK